MEKYDIFIEAGQSNAEGYGHGPVEKPYIPHERILYLTQGEPVAAEYEPKGEMKIQIAAERPNPAFGPEDRIGDLSLRFAREYLDAGFLAADRKLLIIRSAVGATGFLKHYWGMEDPLYLRMLRMTDHALSLNPQNRLMGLLWHQGEHEAAFQNDPRRYQDQLTELVKSVRNRYEAPRLPFICGGFCDQWAQKNQPECDQIMDAIRGAAKELGGIYVDTQDLRSNDQKCADGDEIHFCREALQELGLRYFEAYRALR